MMARLLLRIQGLPDASAVRVSGHAYAGLQESKRDAQSQALKPHAYAALYGKRRDPIS
jgi:hypothetical protein